MSPNLRDFIIQTTVMTKNLVFTQYSQRKDRNRAAKAHTAEINREKLCFEQVLILMNVDLR